MAAFIEQYTNSTNPTFVHKVDQALLARALAALQEDPQVPARVAMARKIITNPEMFLTRGCQILAAQGLNANSDDAQIAGAINAMTDLIAATFV